MRDWNIGKISAVVILLAIVVYSLLNFFLLPFMSQTGRVSVTNRNSSSGDGASTTYNIVTLLPKDGIPAIYQPEFVTGAEADAQYDEDGLVMGVEINGDVRAYSIPFLSGHEIVDDVVGGEPIAVTW